MGRNTPYSSIRLVNNMKENKDIIIIVENREKRDLLFKYIASKFEECTCTAYGFIEDIRARNRHIKIATPQLCLKGHYNPDLIIIDSALEYDRGYYIEECYSCVKSPADVISINIFDIVEPLIKKTEQDIDLPVCQELVF